jgi:hypothetical protein
MEPGEGDLQESAAGAGLNMIDHFSDVQHKLFQSTAIILREERVKSRRNCGKGSEI